MAQEYELEINGQPTRYSDASRRMKMYFAEPEQGAGDHTGILLLIAGYGGHARSNVYQKMRKTFADQYDLIVVQCDYLGYRYMQNDQHLTVTEDMLRQVLTPEEISILAKDYANHQDLLAGKTLSGYISLQEHADDYNEMGLIQAMDNLMAVSVLQDIIRENGIRPCRDRVYIYGQSHGAYLAYLCNYLAPGLFTGIIDNSAYLFPYFMEHDREVTCVGELFSLQKIYHYCLADQQVDRESYDLRSLYADFTNHARIVVYHGADDEMIPLQEKEEFLKQIDHVILHVITDREVDGIVFRSTGHSLEADLLKIFAMALGELERMPIPVKEDSESRVNKTFQTKQCRYEMRWETGVPVLYCEGFDNLLSLGKS